MREAGKDTQNTATTTLTVSSQRWNKQICLLGFQEVPDRNAAEALRGSTLYGEVTAEPDDEEGWYSHELEGLPCIGEGGHSFGTVLELLTGPAQDLLVVKTPEGKEVMVPFVEEIVPEVDLEARRITLTPPEGLFD
ncbi:ribosome maturation factor RimM [Nesterenkonia flava]|uniref:ribosome maturation factor RimM n=1 Tax=Nesterenkonia flava TaxID=469799 RepID=UPI0031D8127D